MNLVTVATRATTAVVAAVAGFSSYQHIVEVALRAGEHVTVATVLPLSIDGLIVVGTMAMVDDKRAGRHPRRSARVALGVGVVATLAANIASAQPHLTARLVAAVPAVAFLITVEVLARTGRVRDDVPPPAEVLEAVVDEPVRDPWDYAVPIGPEPAAAPEVDGSADVKPAVTRKPRKAAPPRARAAKVAARNPALSTAEIAAKARVSDATARRAKEQINGHVPDLEDAPV